MGEQPSLIEYKVRPITRFLVTRYEQGEVIDGRCSAGSSSQGEFDNFDTAYAVAYALAKADHDRMGWPIADERIQYPRHEQFGDVEPEEVRRRRYEGLVAMTAQSDVDGI